MSLIACILFLSVYAESSHQSTMLSPVYGQSTEQPPDSPQQEAVFEPDRDIEVITDEDTTVTINVLLRETNLPGSDEKDFDVTWVSTTARGRAVLNNDDTISYSPYPAKFPAGSSISDTILYRVQQTIKGDDSAVPTSIMRKAIVWINQTNDAPVAFDMDYVSKSGSIVNLNLRAFDSDGDKLTYVLIPRAGGAPIFNNQTGRLTFSPSSDFQGIKQFDFIARDNTTTSNTATVTISVTGTLTDEDMANNALQIKPIPPSSSVNHFYLSQLGGPNALSVASVSARSENNAFHVIGEISNTLGFAVANTTVNIELYDKSNNMIASQTGPTLYNILPNEDRSSFDLVLQNTSSGIDASKILYYYIWISWKDPTLEDPIGQIDTSGNIDILGDQTKPRFLKMTIDDIFLDQCGYYHITGKVGNLGRDDTKDIVIHAASYNEQQQILSIAHTITRSDGTWLSRGEFTPFDIVLDSPKDLSELMYISINAQSDLYSVMSDSNNSPSSLVTINKSLPKLSTFTISTDKKIYDAGENTINIETTITGAPDSEDNFIVIELTSVQGTLLERATFSASNSSTFSIPLKLYAEASWHGKIFAIRATYGGQVASTAFTIIPEGLEYDSDIGKINFNNCLIEQQLSLGRNDKHGEELVPLGNLLGPIVINKNSSVIFSSQFHNGLSKSQPFVLILEGIDVETGLVSFIKYENGTAMPNKTYVAEVVWTPEGDQKLQIKAFLLSGLNEPKILARHVSINIVLE